VADRDKAGRQVAGCVGHRAQSPQQRRTGSEKAPNKAEQGRRQGSPTAHAHARAVARGRGDEVVRHVRWAGRRVGGRQKEAEVRFGRRVFCGVLAPFS